jgi:phosphoribosylamine--glycine ligase
MKFLGIGEFCDLGAMYLRLRQAGHAVKVYVENADFHDVYAGMLNFTTDWQDGYQVIGGSAFGDMLEGNRQYGQHILQEMGMPIANTFQFKDFDKAIAFIRQTQKRYVYKHNGANCERTRNYVSMTEDSADLATLLSHYKDQTDKNQSLDFVLMDYINGIEVGVGAYFNGERFLQPACLDWEHKHFFSGNLGELTGEMGTIVTYRGSEMIFRQSLLKLETKLRESAYCGYINLNMIANAEGLWPLEFTSRFGYPGYSICAALQQDSWEALFQRMLNKSSLSIATRAGFAAGVVLNVPPFPYSYGYEELSKGLPISFQPSFSEDDKRHLHFSEVAKLNDHFVTSGVTGNIATAVGRGDTVEAARQQAYELAIKVIVPNVRYRQDIGESLLRKDWQQLVDWGYVADL